MADIVLCVCVCVSVLEGSIGVAVCNLKGLRSLEFASGAEHFVVEENIELVRGCVRLSVCRSNYHAYMYRLEILGLNQS